MSDVKHIGTRLALVRRAEKQLKEIDDYFDDVAHAELSAEEADPRGEMAALRKGLIRTLENEKKLGLVQIEYSGSADK